MNHTSSSEQISKTSSLDSNLILRQYKLDLMARFMEIKSVNPKLRQNQIAKELGCSGSILKRYRNDVNMLSPYRIPPNSHKRRQMISNEDPNRPQMNSNDFKRPQSTSEEPTAEVLTNFTNKTFKNRNKNALKK